MSTKRNNPETIAIHGGDYRSDQTTKAVAVPIYRTTSYEFTWSFFTNFVIVPGLILLLITKSIWYLPCKISLIW